jgi:hypothetical protein
LRKNQTLNFDKEKISLSLINSKASDLVPNIDQKFAKAKLPDFCELNSRQDNYNYIDGRYQISDEDNCTNKAIVLQVKKNHCYSIFEFVKLTYVKFFF